ncbi:unnamed protein product [Chondrus crispus]|uniref:Uncharacterized protein n=1 Tax=Chondrus crispus TaxID=2769 RepID=R7Q5A0_CHOCR|nr:unnamed protein product [Chondrus crispus]XP_005715163.1 unnamed protein product [Chondrus crispus]CDF33204.1 unnamed protein product [Chondrus crispus]CDF35344.1 unnamed protein product [Chondrus crispus]|eukprot:XP_005713007.1 unnamed protein product [Chondrus crispus]
MDARLLQFYTIPGPTPLHALHSLLTRCSHAHSSGHRHSSHTTAATSLIPPRPFLGTSYAPDRCSG